MPCRAAAAEGSAAVAERPAHADAGVFSAPVLRAAAVREEDMRARVHTVDSPFTANYFYSSASSDETSYFIDGAPSCNTERKTHRWTLKNKVKEKPQLDFFLSCGDGLVMHFE